MEFPVMSTESWLSTFSAVTDSSCLASCSSFNLEVSHTLNSPTSPPPWMFQKSTQPPAPHATRLADSWSLACRVCKRTTCTHAVNEEVTIIPCHYLHPLHHVAICIYCTPCCYLHPLHHVAICICDMMLLLHLLYPVAICI